MASPHVPTFGNWDNGDNVPYTAHFDKARQGRTTGKMINPNDSQENPELFSQTAPRAQPQPLRPNHELKTSSEFKHFFESPARGARGPSSARPIRKSNISENSLEKSPHHYQAKIAANRGSSSPVWDGKSSYDSTHCTPERSRLRPANGVRETPDRAAAVPKFGEWDENNPSSSDSYTHIFNKVREERHNADANSPNRFNEPSHPRQKYNNDDHTKCCCFPWGRK